MLLATFSQAALERSSSGRITTWFRMPTRPFSRRKPRNFCALISPPLGLHVLGMDMAALGDLRHGLADVGAVLEDGIARGDIPQTGSASCRERVCQYLYISVSPISIYKKS